MEYSHGCGPMANHPFRPLFGPGCLDPAMHGRTVSSEQLWGQAVPASVRFALEIGRLQAGKEAGLLPVMLAQGGEPRLGLHLPPGPGGDLAQILQETHGLVVPAGLLGRDQRVDPVTPGGSP